MYLVIWSFSNKLPNITHWLGFIDKEDICNLKFKSCASMGFSSCVHALEYHNEKSILFIHENIIKIQYGRRKRTKVVITKQ